MNLLNAQDEAEKEVEVATLLISDVVGRMVSAHLISQQLDIAMGCLVKRLFDERKVTVVCE